MGSESNDDVASGAVAVVSQVLKAAGDDPKLRRAGQHLAEATEIAALTIRNLVLPLAAMNYAFHKAEVYFRERFSDELAEKVKNVPPDRLVEPKPSVAGPALQGLAFSLEEPSLKDMYLRLLATAMDGAVADEAHPAFVEVIKQLTGAEAQLLPSLLRPRFLVPVVEIRKRERREPKGNGYFRSDAGSWETLEKHVAQTGAAGVPAEVPRHAMMIDNWVRLGLIEVSYVVRVSGEDAYSWVEARPEFVRCKALHESDSQEVVYERGSIEATQFGLQFARAIGQPPVDEDKLSP